MIESLIPWLASCNKTPYAFVLGAFPWGEPSTTLQNYSGPEPWQKDFLLDIERRLLTAEQAILEATASGHGVGKLGLLNSIVPTPTGPKTWGDLRVGDIIFGADGEPVPILATQHWYKVPGYRVSFDDGSYMDTSGGHLWCVRGRQERRKSLDGWRVLSTEDILKLGVTRSNGATLARQWEIPIQGAVQFEEREIDLHPYLVGLWLSDGTKGTSKITKPYPEVWERLSELGYEHVEVDEKTRRVLNISELMDNEMFNLRSTEREIPDDYLYNSIENRWELFRGLCDGDGKVHGSGSIGYSTTSKQLALDVIQLARSLGFKAMLQPTPKQGQYYDKAMGWHITCNECYRVTINATRNPFTIAHRQKAWKPSEDRYLKRWISSIEPIGPVDGMCVQVPGNLYLANDYIVTHNSTLVAWLILWAFSTAPDTRGVITANTETQLKTKTWAELGKWFNLFIAKDFFTLTATALLSKDTTRERTWRIDQVPWSEKNTEAFAGLHNKGKRILLIFDEGSAIPDIIWEVAQGALTDADTEILWLVFGNPTRNVGRFRDCFGSDRHGEFWHTRQVDSRNVSITNKTQIDRWIKEYGDDSDFVRIRVKGEFPRTGEMEFISAADVDAAMQREPISALTDPLALGVDVARYGANASVLFFRKGRDGATMPRQKYRGLSTVELASRVMTAYTDYSPDGIFVDGGGVGGGVVDNLRALQLHCWDVQFGGKDDIGGNATGNQGERYANKRAAMWGAMRSWLKVGCLPKDPDLKAQLLSPMYALNVRGEIQLESKEDMMRRGVESPDDADALALTFAYPLQPTETAGGPHAQRKGHVDYEYDPFSTERMLT